MTQEEELRRLRQIIVGNGEVGLVGEVHAQKHLIAGIRHDLTENTKKLDELVRERRDERARREGSINTLNWIKWLLGLVLTVVLIGGAVAGYQLDQRWEQVQQQIQRIPALPE